MITFENLCNSEPFHIFYADYKLAIENKQDNIDACCISSYNKKKDLVSSRYVNIKYVINKDFYFFSNYLSNKAVDFKNHSQISCLFFWPKTNTQIRIQAHIKIANKNISNQHFENRSKLKNAVAISSMQSKYVENFKDIEINFKEVLKKIENKDYVERPSYWGGFFFTPYYFEFWYGNDKSRLNKRIEYQLSKEGWTKKFLQP